MGWARCITKKDLSLHVNLEHQLIHLVVQQWSIISLRYWNHNQQYNITTTMKLLLASAAVMIINSASSVSAEKVCLLIFIYRIDDAPLLLLFVPSHIIMCSYHILISSTHIIYLYHIICTHHRRSLFSSPLNSSSTYIPFPLIAIAIAAHLLWRSWLLGAKKL